MLDLRESIEGTEWTWERPGVSETLRFLKDGSAQHDYFNGKWEVVGPRSLKVTSARMATVLEFNENVTSYKAVSGNPQQDGVKGRKK